MTHWQEAKLAREAEMCFSSLALVTDYDCWKSDTEAVVIEDVLRILTENAELARDAIAKLSGSLPKTRACACRDALRDAIITDPGEIPEALRSELKILIGKYVEGCE
jgi:5'-methylthioadenosine phosphorylase